MDFSIRHFERSGAAILKKHILACLALALSLVFLFSGCSLRFTALPNLLRPPKPIGEYSGLQESFESYVATATGKNFLLKTPITGDYRSSFIMYDMDNDCLLYTSDRFEREHGGQHIEIFTVARRLYGIDIPDQLKGIDHRYVPPELRALPEHHTDVAHMLLSLLPGRFPIDAAGAAVWRQKMCIRDSSYDV